MIIGHKHCVIVGHFPVVDVQTAVTAECCENTLLIHVLKLTSMM